MQGALLRWSGLMSGGAACALLLFGWIASAIRSDAGPPRRGSHMMVLKPTPVRVNANACGWIPPTIRCPGRGGGARLVPPAVPALSVARPELEADLFRVADLDPQFVLGDPLAQRADDPPSCIGFGRGVYPPSAASAGIEGFAVLRLRVGPRGQVTHAEVVHSEPRGIFERSALEAVRHWRCRPTQRDGVAVARDPFEVRIEFNLDRARS